jgi:hypothetical protein
MTITCKSCRNNLDLAREQWNFEKTDLTNSRIAFTPFSICTTACDIRIRLKE